MNVVDPAFGSTDMWLAAFELNLIPSEAAHFRGAQPVPISQEDHGGVAVPIAGSLPGSVLKPLYLFSVRYSLGRSSELGALRGTVRFTMVEGSKLRADFAM
jgi:hypothetical protein